MKGEHVKPECTAACDVRELLEAAVHAIASADNCPFTLMGPLYDGLHVDVTDPECYARCAEFGPEWGVQCHICVVEALQERVCAAGEAEKL
jgi:hypothetical protein